MTKHLFILSPSSSGSTLLLSLLATSPNASTMRSEGQWLVPAILGTKDRWDPNKSGIDWSRVKKVWRSHWDLSKPILLEKSPPNVVRYKQLRDNFENPHFVCLNRHPYYFCESIRRKYNVPFKEGVRLWILISTNLKECIESEPSIAVKYEDLTTDTSGFVDRMLEFLPELESLDYNRDFTIQKKVRPISNINLVNDKNLSTVDKNRLNSLLASTDLLSYFDYTLDTK